MVSGIGRRELEARRRLCTELRDRGRQTLSMVHNEHPLKQQINRGPRAPCRFARLRFLLRLVYILIGILINGIVSVDVRSEVVNHDGSRMCVGDCQSHTAPQLAPSPSLPPSLTHRPLSVYRPVPRPSLVHNRVLRLLMSHSTLFDSDRST